MGRSSWSVVEANGRSRLGASLASAFISLAALACGDGSASDAELSAPAFSSESEPFEDSEVVEAGAVEVVAETHIRHFTITFSSTSGGPEPEVSVAAGANCLFALRCDRHDPVTELREAYEPQLGRLTHLELFRALAPGVRPPAALLASHAVEALDAGRDNDRVLELEPLVPRLSGSESALLPIVTVAELFVDGVTYRFRAAGSGPDAMVFVTESGATEGLSMLTRLAITYGDLTLLETFLALAPDEAPPLALVATHSREIERMGTRVDDTIRYGLTLPPAH